MKQRLLIAEDEHVFVSILKFIFRDRFDVVVAKNGMEAWKLLQESYFDLVITDCQMPQMTGLELCTRMRSEDRFRFLPIILVTAKVFELDAEQLQDEFGLCRIFPKPFTHWQLSDAADELLRIRAGSLEKSGHACETQSSIKI